MAILLIFTKPKHIFIEDRRDTQQGLALSLALHGWRCAGWRTKRQCSGESIPTFWTSVVSSSTQEKRMVIASLYWRLPCGVIPSITTKNPTSVRVFMATVYMGNFFRIISVDGWEPASSCRPAEIHLPGGSTGLAGSSPSPRCGCWQELCLLSAFTSLD